MIPHPLTPWKALITHSYHTTNGEPTPSPGVVWFTSTHDVTRVVNSYVQFRQLSEHVAGPPTQGPCICRAVDASAVQFTETPLATFSELNDAQQGCIEQACARERESSQVCWSRAQGGHGCRSLGMQLNDSSQVLAPKTCIQRAQWQREGIRTSREEPTEQ